MLPILLYTTLFFWLASLAEVSLLSYWAGDPVFIVLFAWSLYYIGNIEKHRLQIWALWLPPIFGLGMSSFLFFSYWMLVPYLAVFLFLTYLILRRAKWIFRLKEGSWYCFLTFAIFGVVNGLIHTKIFNYSLFIDFYLKLAISFLICSAAWSYFVAKGRGEKIR
jgi:hypothetical protein